MKTVTCKDCGTMRSGRIKACSACEDGTRRITARLVALVLLAVTAIGSQIVTDTPFGARSADATTTGATVWSTAASGKAGVACEEELACWGNLHHDAAVMACKSEMTRQRGASLQWVRGYAFQNFDEYAWHPTAPLAVAYSGDGARIVAPDGGLRLVSYTCDFDPVDRAVIGLRID